MSELDVAIVALVVIGSFALLCLFLRWLDGIDLEPSRGDEE